MYIITLYHEDGYQDKPYAKVLFQEDFDSACQVVEDYLLDSLLNTSGVAHEGVIELCKAIESRENIEVADPIGLEYDATFIFPDNPTPVFSLTVWYHNRSSNKTRWYTIYEYNPSQHYEVTPPNL